ncbi:MAG: rRNA maturation RNase YbeY [Bacteroidales bacterium]|nr:rRNA maturation RNase YbeY [Bacteroidales bacterium]MDT8431169.1 rRNA maturation RNase YbeY [Bacteroidales bacterium]
MPVFFHSETTDFSLEKQHLLQKWIQTILSEHNKQVGNLNIIFTSNDYLLEINRKYLNHNYFTDVISFDDSDGNVISGDIFVSIDQVKINSMFHNVGFINELCRVMIHGVLHLVGFNDANAAQQQVMRELEDHALNVLEVMDNGKDI